MRNLATATDEISGLARFLPILALAILLQPLSARSTPATQRELGTPTLRVYTPDDYGAHSQNWAVLEDSAGVLYVGNTDGLLTYDGSRWALVTTPDRAAVRSLAAGPGGRIYVGAKADLGVVERDDAGALRFVSLRSALAENHRRFGDVWQTFSTKRAVCFQTETALMVWEPDPAPSAAASAGRFTVHTPERTFWRGYRVAGTYYVQDTARGLLRLEEGRLDLAPGGELLRTQRVDALLATEDDRRLLAVSPDRLQLLGPGGLTPFAQDLWPALAELRPYAGVRLPSGSYALATLRGGVLVIDREGGLAHRIDDRAGLPKAMALHVFSDREEGLWVAMDRGLARLEVPSPVTRFGEEAGLQGKVYALARRGGALYAGTSEGLLVLRGAADGESRARFVSTEGIESQTWSLSPFGDQLLAGTNDGVYAVEGAVAERLVNVRTYVLRGLRATPGTVWLGTGRGVRPLHIEGGLEALGEPVATLQGEIRYLEEDADGALWAGLRPTGVARVRFTGEADGNVAVAGVDRFDEADGLGRGATRIFSWRPAHGGPPRLAFASENGVHRFDEASRRFVADATLTSALARVPTRRGEELQRVAQGADGALWLQHGGTNLLLRRDGRRGWRFVPSSLSAASLGLVFAVHVEGSADRTVAWFGGVDGVIRYDTAVDRVLTTPFPLHAHVRRVTWDGRPLALTEPGELVFGSNTMRFDFVAPSFRDESLTRYQYRLVGFDDSWSPWSAEDRATYTNLAEGRYVFQIRARNACGVRSDGTSWPFDVAPPWHRSAWAYALYAAAALLLVLLAVRLWTWRLRRRNRELEATVADRTREVRRQAEDLRHKNEENERLLLNVLPAPIAARLKQGEQVIADGFREATVLFADMVGFTPLSARVSSQELVSMLNRFFSAFDELCDRFGVEKIKTIGDAYMAVGGLPVARPGHAPAVVEMALEMLKATARLSATYESALELRIGVHSGPVVAGVIGQKKFIYDLWGDTVNTASRMESHGVVSRVQITDATRALLGDDFVLEERGPIEVKGKGAMRTWLVVRRDPAA